MRRTMGILLALALLLCRLPARAEVRRGDRGEEVRYLQWLLAEDGWLFEEPDGVFGARTEQAIREYQAYKGLEQTGVADEELMQLIDQDRIRLGKLQNGDGYYKPYPGSYVPPFETGLDALEDEDFGCVTTALRDYLYREFCADHAPLLGRELALTADGSAEGWADAAALWQGAAARQFGLWIHAAPDRGRMPIVAAYAAWSAFALSHYNALAVTQTDPAVVERQQCALLRNFAGSLCEARIGPPYDRDREFLPDEDESGHIAHCLLTPGDEASEEGLCCDEHAALLNREYERYFEEADPMEGLPAVVGDWTDAVDALYAEWSARCAREDAREDVTDAQARFHRLLDALEAANCDDVGRLRILQWECARLCELLHDGGAAE